jgi:hypothetical protein
MNFTNLNYNDIDITLIKKTEVEDLIKEIKEIDNTKEKFSCKELLLSNYSKLLSLEKINLREFEIKNEEEKNIFDIFKEFISNEKIKFINLETNKFTFQKNNTETFISINLSTISSNVTDYLNNLPNNLTNLEIEYMPYTWVNSIVKEIVDEEDDVDVDDRNYFVTDIIFNNLNINNLPVSLRKIIFKMDICRSNLFVNIFLDKIEIPCGVVLEFNFINSNYVKKVCVNKIIIPNHIKNILIKYLHETRISLMDDMIDDFKKNNIICEIMKDTKTKNKLIMYKILSCN